MMTEERKQAEEGGRQDESHEVQVERKKSQIEQSMESFFNYSNQLAKDNLPSSLNTERFITEVDRRCYHVAYFALASWIALILLSYYVGRDDLEKLSGVERQAPMLAAMLLGMCFITTIIPTALRGRKRSQSGIIICAAIVQFIAFTTDMMLAFLPVPVLLNPLTKTRVYLLRWCEWTPLAFVMTFLTESCRMGRCDEVSVKTYTFGEKISNLLSVIREQNAIEHTNKDRDAILKKEMRLLVGLELKQSYYLAWSQCLII